MITRTCLSNYRKHSLSHSVHCQCVNESSCSISFDVVTEKIESGERLWWFQAIDDRSLDNLTWLTISRLARWRAPFALKWLPRRFKWTMVYSNKNSMIVVGILSAHLIDTKRITNVQNTFTADVIVVQDQRGQCLGKEYHHHYHYSFVIDQWKTISLDSHRGSYTNGWRLQLPTGYSTHPVESIPKHWPLPWGHAEKMLIPLDSLSNHSPDVLRLDHRIHCDGGLTRSVSANRTWLR